MFASLAALTRPDGLIYAGAFPLAALLQLHRDGVLAAVRASVVSVVAFGLPVLAYLAWRLSTFGEYLPNTAVAKSPGLPGGAALARPADLVGYVGWLTALLAVVCVGAALALLWAARNALVVILVPLGLAVVAFGVLPPDWMAQLRFATAIWPLAALVGVIAGVHVVAQLSHRGRAVVGALAAVAVVSSGPALADAARTFRNGPSAPLCLVAQNTGHTMNVYARLVGAPNASVLAPDLGGAALTSGLRSLIWSVWQIAASPGSGRPVT